jgi:hypothetical protein
VVTGDAGTVTSADIASVVVTCTTNEYVINVGVAGLAGTGLILQNNSGDDLPILADGTVAFTTPVPSGGGFAVTVANQPTNLSQTCTVTDGSGTISNDNVTAQITCSTNSYHVGGTVTGLTGTGLVLNNNAGDPQPISADGGFTFSTTLLSGQPYAVTVATDPTLPWQTCTVTNDAGTVTSADITSIAVDCTTNTYVVNVGVTGLNGSGLVVQNNGGDDLPISGNGTVAFAAAVPSGTNYDVTVLTPPTSPAQTCTITDGSGTISNSHVTAQILCTNDEFTVGGIVTGLPVGASVELINNCGDNLTMSADGNFTFATALVSGSSYSVAALSSAGAICMVANGSGTGTTDAITDVVVTCSAAISGGVTQVVIEAFGAAGGNNALACVAVGRPARSQ